MNIKNSFLKADSFIVCKSGKMLACTMFWKKVLILCVFLLMQKAYAASLDPESMSALSIFARAYQLIRTYYVYPVSGKLLIVGAINGMLHVLDPHSTFLDSEQFQEFKRELNGRFSGFGFFLISGRIKNIAIVDSLIAGGPAEMAGVRSHDVVVSLDGKSVQNMSTHQLMVYLKNKSQIRLGILRNGKISSFVIVRGNIKIKSVKFANINHIGYIRISCFNARSAYDVKKSLLQMIHDKGFILDLRGNPGGLIDQAIDVVRYFLKSGAIVIIKTRDPLQVKGLTAINGDITHGKPLVVLIDNQTASAAEIVAGALQDHKRAILIGKRSFGKGSIQTIFPIDRGEEALKFTTANYYTPSGRSIQGVGIMPDILLSDHDSDHDQNFILQESESLEKKEKSLMTDYYIYRAVQYINNCIVLKKCQRHIKGQQFSLFNKTK